VLNNFQEKLVGVVRTYFSGAARQSIFLLLAFGFALAARFDSEPLHQTTTIQLVSVKGGSQKADLTAFCPMLKYVNEEVSLHFKMSVPRDLRKYDIFSTSQSDGGIRFFINEARQLIAEHGSSKLVLSEPIVLNLAGGIDIDILVTMMIDPLYEGDPLVVFKAVNSDLEETYALMLPTEFNQIKCDNQGLIGIAAENSPLTITARGYISPAAQKADRSTVVLRALTSLSFSVLLAMKLIRRKQEATGNHE
jgi:hypothetical protein